MSVAHALKNPFSRGAAGTQTRAKALPLPDFSVDDDDDDDQEDAGEPIDQVTDEQLLAEACPPAWDFFDVDPVKLRTKKANDEPIGIQRVRFQRIVKGERRGIKGEYDARAVNRAWLLHEHGPGTYFVTGINSRGTYVVGGRIELEAVSGLNARPSPLWNNTPQSPALGGGPDRGQLADQIIQAAVQRLMTDTTPRAQQDPIRESFAAVTKMFQLQMTSMQLAQQQQSSARETDPLAMMLLKEMISERRRPEPQRESPLDEAFKFVTLGMQLKDMLGGGGAADGEPPDPWMDILKTAIDRMGPGTVSLLSHAFLPADHASSVDDMIKAAATGAPPEEKPGS